PGFMFGAEVHGQVHLSLLFLYAQVTAELGFDVAMEHVTNPPSGCVQADGSFGLNQGYGMGRYYDAFKPDVSLQVEAGFYHADVELASDETSRAAPAGLTDH